MSKQPALAWRLPSLPLVRLKDGTHVTPRVNGQPQAFLPSKVKTGFPTVHPSVCSTSKAREFLRTLGVAEPDPVDDVIRNVLPRYRADEIEVNDVEYEGDIRRILAAFATDSKVQREKLLQELCDITFVQVVDCGDRKRYFAAPSSVYLATERLKGLFAGVSDVLLVNDSYDCLRGEAMRELLEACGAVRYLRPERDHSLSWRRREELRIEAGHPETSGKRDEVTDCMLNGLPGLLTALPNLEIDDRRNRAKLLWEELAHLAERRGNGVFSGEYKWTHYGSYQASFDAAFVRRLNETPWVPDANGDLQRPEGILFDTLGWRPNPFLQSKIRFRPPVVEQLAREVGIEPDVLDLLKRMGMTNVPSLLQRLRPEEEPGTDIEDEAQGDAGDNVSTAVKSPLGDAFEPTPPVRSSSEAGPEGGPHGDGRGPCDGTSSSPPSEGAPRGDRHESVPDGGPTDRPSGEGGKRRPGTPGGRPFISYVAVHPDEDEPDPDNLDQETRMRLEEQAIDLIVSCEPLWKRTPTHNPGYDLFQAGEDGQPVAWCEVKAMTGDLKDRPVGVSHTQFGLAQRKAEAYWLYVVERAGTEDAHIVRIQDPAGKTKTYTFDHGWLEVAKPEEECRDA